MQRVMLIMAALSVPVSSARAALALSQNEGAIPAVYANGGGGGFGGTLGSGSITMDVVGANLDITFVPGNALNDIVGLYLDTKSGGFVDADMNDTADGGRMVLSNLTLTQDDVFPSGLLPDYGLAIGSFGSVLFELNAGNTPAHLNFLQFNAATTISIPLATLGNPAAVDFFAGYASGGGYNSNESLPATTSGANQAGNPGFGDGQFGGLTTGATYDNFNRFVIVPEPTTLGLLLLGSIGLLPRRRAH